MACTSLVALPRQCGAAGVIGGTEKLHIMAYADAEVGANGEIYTTTATGVVSDISVVTGKQFVEVGLLKSTVGITEELTKNAQNGTAYFTQTIPLTLSDLTAENRSFVESVLNQPVIILIKTRTGKYFAAGLNGQLELSGLTGGTGVAEGDLVGYTLTFSGLDTKLIPMVDSTLIPTLIVPAE